MDAAKTASLRERIAARYRAEQIRKSGVDPGAPAPGTGEPNPATRFAKAVGLDVELCTLSQRYLELRKQDFEAYCRLRDQTDAKARANKPAESGIPADAPAWMREQKAYEENSAEANAEILNAHIDAEVEKLLARKKTPTDPEP